MYDQLHKRYKELEMVLARVTKTDAPTRRPVRRLSDIEDGLEEQLDSSMGDAEAAIIPHTQREGEMGSELRGRRRRRTDRS